MPQQESQISINLSAAEAVAFRFPADWADGMAEPAVEVASTEPVASAEPVARYAVASVGSMPVLFNSAQTPTDNTPIPLPPVRPASLKPDAAPHPVAAKPKPTVQSNAVLNSAQIAGIKKRLNLTPDQERYWPAVEAELRKMEYKKPQKGETRTAAIDMTKVDVDGLKSAGFPLVMSFNDEQRRELKSLAHLLGLEKAMAGL